MGVEVLQGRKLLLDSMAPSWASRYLPIQFNAPDLTTFGHLDALGLQATGQKVTAARAVIEC